MKQYFDVYYSSRVIWRLSVFLTFVFQYSFSYAFRARSLGLRRLHYTYVALHGQAYRNDDVCTRVERSAFFQHFLHFSHFLICLDFYLCIFIICPSHVCHLQGQIQSVSCLRCSLLFLPIVVTKQKMVFLYIHGVVLEMIWCGVAFFWEF